MSDRETIEQLLMEVSRKRTEAQVEATQASDQMIRLLSGLTPIPEVAPEPIRAVADTLCSALQKLSMLTQTARDLRTLLM